MFRVLIVIIEIMFFIRVYDLFVIKVKFEYEFFNINKCIKKIFKNLYYFFELVLFKFVFLFLIFNVF